MAPDDGGDAQLRARLDSILGLLLHPDAQSWTLGADGAWKFAGGSVDVQAVLQHRALDGHPSGSD